MIAPDGIQNLIARLGVIPAEISTELGVTRAAVTSLLNDNGRIPRSSTITRLLTAINAILSRRGSERRLTYDEIWAAFRVGRLHIVPVAAPDTAADLTSAPSGHGAPPVGGAT